MTLASCSLFDRLTLLKLGLEVCIRRPLFQRSKLAEIRDPPVADGRADQIRQRGIRLQQPAPLRDAIGLVVESFRPKLGKIGHERRLDQLGVNCGNAVDRMAADDRQIGHAHLFGRGLLDQRHPPEPLGVVPGRRPRSRSRKRRLIS